MDTDPQALTTFAMIGASIQARHIEVPMAAAIVVHVEESSLDAAERLTAGIDNAPVMAADGSFVGLFSRSSARSDVSVSASMRPLDSRLLVSADTPISALAGHLSTEPFLLVLSGRDITGFVTPADMGSSPARTYFYLHLAELEVSLAELVRSRYRDAALQEEAVRALPPKRQGKYAELKTELIQSDSFVDPIAALSVTDLLAIAKNGGFATWLNARGTRGWGYLTKGLSNFRNDVMHPVRPFTKATPESMNRLRQMADNIATLAAEARLFREARASTDNS